MAASTSSAAARMPQIGRKHRRHDLTDNRLRELYPMVKEWVTPLPRAWHSQDKCEYIDLSDENLRAEYKGPGESQEDAASVRATHPIPSSCGLFYFEVKIVSKGRDGYIGIGLSRKGLDTCRLPGWDRFSFGYHGDDGCVFCASETGVPYGPTFTTGDVIGCGVNFIDNTCFYTKNGHNLGVAFTHLPNNLYPTVGLETPGEVVDANFGQDPFVFDIDDMIKELKARVKATIESFPVPGDHMESVRLLQKMALSYLIHYGYSKTAVAFSEQTKIVIIDGIASIENRQKILNMVMLGRMGDAIQLTSQLYPWFLANRPNLHFMLKCRQFIEMAHGLEGNRISSLYTRPLRRKQKADEPMETDQSSCSFTGGRYWPPGISPAAYGSSLFYDMINSESVIKLGKELANYGQHLFCEFGENEVNKKVLKDTYWNLAFSYPWRNPFDYLCSSQREKIASQLNSAILESSNQARKPPLEIALAHSKELLQLMLKSDISASVFADVDDIFKN